MSLTKGSIPLESQTQLGSCSTAQPKCEGTALNNHLFAGPDLTKGRSGVLCKLRKYPIAVICDLEMMFYRFHVSHEERAYLRFLQWENRDTNSDPNKYFMKVHLFGATSSPGCANYGMKYLANQNQKEHSAAANFIRKNFYVDNGFVSVEDVDTAIKLVREAQTVCAKVRLHIHNCSSNNREVLESIPDVNEQLKLMMFISVMRTFKFSFNTLKETRQSMVKKDPQYYFLFSARIRPQNK